ncbi:hypothetical protein OK074_7852 [Actinobacteria bacterium OK074]|nr:hypothetical protein OK074_7852 [Actinobacteria bacterium OK074]
MNRRVSALTAIAGAATDAAAGSAAPSASASDSAGRPTITLPKGMRNVFEGWETGDTAKDAVLADARQALNSTDFAVSRGDTDSKALAFYYQGDALLSEVKWVQAWLDAGTTWTGTTRYLTPQVTLQGKKTAVVVYCSNAPCWYEPEYTPEQKEQQYKSIVSSPLYTGKAYEQRGFEDRFSNGNPYTDFNKKESADGSIGEPWAKGESGEDPPCGIEYLRSSDGGAFHLKATITWQITWEGSNGETGTLPNGTFGTTQDVTVEEAQAVNQ